MEDDLKIILFLCNWCPHAAFQTLQDTLAPLPREVRMIRIPCSGRITKSLLFKAFETGADGVALVGCKPGTCRYGIGTRVAERNVEDTRGILRLLGLGEERLGFASFYPDQPSEMLDFLNCVQKQDSATGQNTCRTSPSNRKTCALARVGCLYYGHPQYQHLPGLRQMFIRMPGNSLRKRVFPESNRKRRSNGRPGLLLHQGGHLVMPYLRPLL